MAYIEMQAEDGALVHCDPAMVAARDFALAVKAGNLQRAWSLVHPQWLTSVARDVGVPEGDVPVLVAEMQKLDGGLLDDLALPWLQDLRVQLLTYNGPDWGWWAHTYPVDGEHVAVAFARDPTTADGPVTEGIAYVMGETPDGWLVANVSRFDGER